MPRANTEHMRAIYQNRDKLTEWEGHFFADIQQMARRRKGLSPKQATKIAEMAERFSKEK